MKFRDGNEAAKESTKVQKVMDEVMAMAENGDIRRPQCIDAAGSEKLADKAISMLHRQRLLETMSPGVYRMHVENETR